MINKSNHQIGKPGLLYLVTNIFKKKGGGEQEDCT